MAAAVHHPALVQRLALRRGARHQLQLRALLRVRGVDRELLQDVRPRQRGDLHVVTERGPVGGGAGEGMLLG